MAFYQRSEDTVMLNAKFVYVWVYFLGKSIQILARFSKGCWLQGLKYTCLREGVKTHHCQSFTFLTGVFPSTSCSSSVVSNFQQLSEVSLPFHTFRPVFVWFPLPVLPVASSSPREFSSSFKVQLGCHLHEIVLSPPPALGLCEFIPTVHRELMALSGDWMVLSHWRPRVLVILYCLVEGLAQGEHAGTICWNLKNNESFNFIWVP